MTRHDRLFQDETAFRPFKHASSPTLAVGRAFYFLPHDARRRLVSILRHNEYEALQRLRRTPPSSHIHSFSPFDERRCIFVHIPKSAGVAVARALFEGLGGGHAHVGLYEIVFSRQEFDSYFKFTFVRNPWDRLLSAFLSLKHGGMDEHDRRWASSHGHLDFEAFVTQWLNETSALSQIHFVPQYRFICAPYTRRLAVDFVGRFEQLDTDFDYVRSRLGLGDSPRLTLENVGPTDRRCSNFRDYYTPRMREIVGRVYRRDIDLLGYAFDD